MFTFVGALFRIRGFCVCIFLLQLSPRAVVNYFLFTTVILFRPAGLMKASGSCTCTQNTSHLDIGNNNKKKDENKAHIIVVLNSSCPLPGSWAAPPAAQACALSAGGRTSPAGGKLLTCKYLCLKPFYLCFHPHQVVANALPGTRGKEVVLTKTEL